MEQKTTVDLVGGQDLQKAMDRAVLSSAVEATVSENSVSGASAEAALKPRAVSPLTGAPTPPGRTKGVRNKLTNLRDAVLEAFDQVGGVKYLVKLANGTQSDRAAFTSLMNKVLPTQINQQVDGGIRLELSWLGGRNIGTTQSQVGTQTLQVLDVERETDGTYRIKDPQLPADGGVESPAGGDAEGPTAQKAAGGAGDA